MVDVKTKQAARRVFKVSRGGCVRVKEHSRNRMGGMWGRHGHGCVERQLIFT